MKRKGFTLVELLIVIVVIGVLAAMMMISSTEATTSAKATAIISNLRNLRTAALEYYADNETEAKDIDDGDDLREKVIEYLKASDEQTIDENYKFAITDEDWYVTYEIQGTATERTKIAKKLENRRNDVGLLEESNKDTPFGSGGTTVGLFIR